MTLRISTGLSNGILHEGSLRDLLQNGELQIYSGSQPAGADSATSGTLLATITDNGGARTAETIATGSVELTAGSAGSVDDLTVDGVSIIDAAVPFNTSLTQTATDLATAINEGLTSPDYRASAAGAIVTISARRGSGASPNAFVVASTLTTMTATDTDMAGGVDAANGLKFGSPAARTISKASGQTWSGTAVATGTAGWFRIVGSVADGSGADSSEVEIRVDGAIATSGAELNLPSTAIASGAVQSITSLQFTMPGS